MGGESASFGKYENDALSWEKWSTFSPNKYLEEVGKCSTPGSVAQKKAFFEAHYKKIAAMKAEADLLDQQKPPSGSDQDTFQQQPPQVEAEILIVDQFQCAKETSSVNHESFVDQSCYSLELEHSLPLSDKLEEAVLVNDDETMNQHFHMNSEIPKVAPKVGMKKKPAASIIPDSSSTRLSKPKATPTSSFKNPNASSSNTKNTSISEGRRITPTSLHLSMSMNSEYSETPSSVTSSRRRSLFMEQMGDKDIVKRAFKTFQNRVNKLPSSQGKSSGPKQLPTKGSEQKVSSSMTYQKENELSKKKPHKIAPTRAQLGPTWKSVSLGSLNGVGVDERSIKAAPTSVVLRSNERAEKQKEFFKEKSNAREAERIQLGSKSKELKDAEMKRLRQKLSFKARPMPSFYRTQGVSKSTSEKEAIKNGTARRVDSHR